MEDRPVRVAKTGYTGEPIGYELYCESRDARYFWDRLIELGARPTALGARDTLRMEASLPLYGHEMGECEFGGEIPVYAVPLAKFAVSFAEEKGRFHWPRRAEAAVRGVPEDHEPRLFRNCGSSIPHPAGLSFRQGRSAQGLPGLQQGRMGRGKARRLCDLRHDDPLFQDGGRGTGNGHHLRDGQALHRPCVSRFAHLPGL